MTARGHLVGALTGLVTLGIASVALAALVPPHTGRFRGASGFRFAFNVRRAVCTTPPRNLSDPKAPAGPKKMGYCFQSFDQPPIRVVCKAPATSTGDRMLILSFDGLLLEKGKLHTKAYTYSSGPKPIGFYELSVAVRGDRASGFVRKRSRILRNGKTLTCDSGTMPFTATHA